MLHSSLFTSLLRGLPSCTDDITKLFEGLHACYDYALNNKCDTSCVREFYLDDVDSSGFSWFDGPLGGSAYGIDEIVDQIHNECQLILEQVPGTTEIVRDNTLKNINNIFEGSCIATQKGENTWNFIGGPKSDSLDQRYSYVMVKPKGKKLQIYTRHASIAAPEPEPPVYSGMMHGKGKK